MSKKTGYVSTNDGVRLYYEEIGNGRPIVLIGGWRMSTPWWQKQVPELSQSFRVISLDMRAYGQSDKASKGHRVARHAKDLYDVIEGLGLENVTPVGWSLGASTLMAYFDLFGGRKLKGAVFVDQTPKILSDDEWKFGLGEGVFPREAITDFSNGILADDAAFVQGFLPGMFAPANAEKLTPEELEWMNAEVLKMPTVAAVTLLIDHINQDWRSMLPAIDKPLLVITGRQSAIFPYQSSVYISEQVSGAELIICEESGHCPFYEEPEKFNAAVAEFVAT